MEFRSYFQFFFRIIFRVYRTFVPRKKKKTSPLKNRHHSKPLRRWCLKTQNHQKVQWKMLALEALQVPRFCQFQDFLRWHNLDLVDVVFFWSQKVWVFRWHGFTPPKRGHECNCYISQWSCPFLRPYLYILLQSCRYTLLYTLNTVIQSSFQTLWSDI